MDYAQIEDMDNSVFDALCGRLHGHASRLLAVCDGAREQDGMGFSKSDAVIGRVFCYTPAECWTVDLAVEAVRVLGKYRRTQLADREAELDELGEAVKAAVVSELREQRAGRVRPRLGMEGGVVTILSRGFGGDAADTKAFKKAAEAAGFSYDQNLAAFRHVTMQQLGGSLPAEMVSALFRLAKDCELVGDEVAAMLDRAERKAVPRGSYVLEVTASEGESLANLPKNGGRFYIAYPYDTEVIADFKQAIGTEWKIWASRFDGAGRYEKCWIANVSPLTARAILDWAERRDIPLIGSARERVESIMAFEAEAKAEGALGPMLMLTNKGDLIIPTPTYNVAFKDWIKGRGGFARFSKVSGFACWEVEAKYLDRFAALLDPSSPHWKATNSEPYRYTPEVAAAVSNTVVKNAETRALENKLIVASGQSSADFTPAPGLGGTFYPFQAAGVYYAVEALRPHQGVIFGDEMGLGKTVQALGVLHEKKAFPAVVVCPSSVKFNWRREVGTWLPNARVAILSGRANPTLPEEGADIYVVNYDILAGYFPLLVPLGIQAVVLDELHYIKSREAQRSKAAKLLASVVPTRLGLSGTPIQNRVLEFSHPLEVIGRMEPLFGNEMRFAKRYGWGDRGEELNRILRASCYIRREKSQVMKELPPKTRTVVDVPLEGIALAEYQATENEAAEWVENKEPGAVLKQINALRQAVGIAKIGAVVAWARDFIEGGGQKLIIFAHHIEVQNGIFEGLQRAGIKTVAISGDMGAEERDKAAQAFQNQPEIGVIVCSLRAASEGLNLTAASNVAHTEQDWNPARMDQGEDRAHRIGQPSAVNCWYFIAPATVDIDMWSLVGSKRQVVTKAVIGANAPVVHEERKSLMDVAKAMLERVRARGGLKENKPAADAPDLPLPASRSVNVLAL